MTVVFSKMLQTEALPVKSLFPIRTNVEVLPQGILPVILITTFVTAISQILRNLGTCSITDALIPMTLQNLDHHCSSYSTEKHKIYNLVTDTTDI